MAKTQEELNELKQEVQQLKEKLQELTDEELNIVTGGTQNPYLIVPVTLMELTSDGGSAQK